MSEKRPDPDVVASPEFLKRAQDCVRVAGSAKTPAEKEGWLNIAESWLKLALPQKSLKQKEFQDQMDAKHTGQKDSTSVN